MIKCFWCGCGNQKESSSCSACKRDLQWSRFFRGMLKPSVGCLLGNSSPRVAKAVAVTVRR